MSEPVIFVSTGPTFMLVQNGLFRELRPDLRVTKKVTKKVKRNENAARNFPHWYDFSRTASSVLRLCMLEASGMINFYNPEFTNREEIRGEMVSNIDPEDANINMADHGNAAQRGFRAQLISSNFDHLFPRSVIEQKLDNMTVNEQRTLSGMMYVIYFNERTIYRTNVSMDVVLSATNENALEVQANTTVKVKKYSYNEPEINDGNREDFTRFLLVKQLINEWNREGQADDPNQLVEEVEELNI